jgi:HAD superfamily hydrolase (TIGR01509 family)
MKAVLFDVDGTLIDSVDFHAEAWVRALRHFGIEAAFADLRAHIGMGGDQLLPVFVPAEMLARQGEEIQAFRSRLFADEYLDRIKPFPAVRALFERCHAAGLTIALASSGQSEEVERYAKIAGIADLVDATTSAGDVEHSKPYPDIFEAALAKCAPAKAADAIVIGDTAYDIEAATRAGIRSIGVLCGGVAETELRKAGAAAIYRDPADLLDRFGSSPLAG